NSGTRSSGAAGRRGCPRRASPCTNATTPAARRTGSPASPCARPPRPRACGVAPAPVPDPPGPARWPGPESRPPAGTRRPPDGCAPAARPGDAGASRTRRPRGIRPSPDRDPGGLASPIMRSRARHAVLVLTGAALAGAPLTAAARPAAARPAAVSVPGTIVVDRGGPARSLPFTAPRDGEAVITFAASAPGVSWARKGAESAVVSIEVDGRKATDLVVPSSEPVERSLGLGRVRKGRHKVTLRFAGGSAPAAERVRLTGTRVRVPSENAVALRHAPIVAGRTGWPFGDPYQNATTDTPLLAWHETRPAATPGHRVIEYSMVWSNEDGGTDTPALMARWGRTTDIEWVYRVEVDESGRRVEGTAVYQAPLHLTFQFTGRYEDDHPVLQTCTDNNNMCDVVSPDPPLRFLLDASGTRPAGRAREAVMDREPWTYRVAAQEMVREGKIERPSDPATRE